MSFSIREIQNEFPQTRVKVGGKPLVYLDSAATALKPRSVIEKVRAHMESEVANVHRGAHFLSDAATAAFEQARADIARFIGAKSNSEIIFTSGTTASINLIAYSFARRVLRKGDEILVSQMEHHSNIVPWQMIAEEIGAAVRFAPIRDDGSLDLQVFNSMLIPRTKLVSLTQLSNALGTWNDLKPLISAAKAVGAVTVVDAAQSVTARRIDVQDLDCDFLAFSGHKVFGPTGIGVLYGRESILNEMPPFFGGGSMIQSVDEEGSTFLPPPHRFEAGTQAIAEAIGLGEAIRFVSKLDWTALKKHDESLLEFAQAEIRKLDGVRVYPAGADRAHVLSFELRGAHHSDVGSMLNEQGIAVRAGHHCCQPLMARLGVTGTVRASFSIYSSEEDVTRFVTALKKVRDLLR